MIAINQYIKRMRSEQNVIFYLFSSTVEAALQSPYVERMKEEDLEVVIFTDKIDEFMMQV
jgi:molecular chaperone HtpG